MAIQNLEANGIQTHSSSVDGSGTKGLTTLFVLCLVSFHPIHFSTNTNSNAISVVVISILPALPAKLIAQMDRMEQTAYL